MRTSACIAAAIAAFLLCACTELHVKRAGPGEIEGIPYTLPKKTFIIEVTYTFKDCKVDGDNLHLYAVKVPKVTPRIEPDENERFFIPYESLRLWFKDTNFTIDSHENQTLKSVSSEITDKTSEAVASIVSSAVKLATFGTTLATLKGAQKESGKTAPKVECNAATAKIANRLKVLRGVEKPSEAEKLEMADLEPKLVHKQVVHWSPTKPKTVSNPLRLTTKVSPRALIGADGEWVKINAPDVRVPPELDAELELTFHGAIAADRDALPSGFLLRQGPNATLRVCRGQCPAPRVEENGAVHREETRVLYSDVHVMPQFGSYVGLPLESRWFDTHTITINMSDQAAITKMGFKSNAAAAAALKSLETNLEALSKAKETRDKAEAAAQSAQQSAKKTHADQVTAENKAISDCLAAQQAVRDKGGSPTGTCQ